MYIFVILNHKKEKEMNENYWKSRFEDSLDDMFTLFENQKDCSYPTLVELCSRLIYEYDFPIESLPQNLQENALNKINTYKLEEKL
jgi:hypothetical protein